MHIGWTPRIQLFLAGECAARGPCRKGFAGNDKAQADCHHRQLLVGPQLSMWGTFEVGLRRIGACLVDAGKAQVELAVL